MEKDLEKLIHDALKEDGYEKDVTSLATIETKKDAYANFFVKNSGVVSGTSILKEIYRQINPKIKVSILKEDGDYVNKGDVIASVYGRMNDIIRGHKVALNFLQRLSGIATITDKFVEELKGTNCLIVDTRNNTPLLRKFEKDAVVHGKGNNSRFNLTEQVLIKDYHILVCGSITDAVLKARSKYNSEMLILVEVQSKEEYLEAIETSCDVVILNEMSNEQIEDLINIPHDNIQIGVSGNIPIGRFRSIALLGVDFIFVDCLTHSYKTLDIKFKFLQRTFK